MVRYRAILTMADHAIEYHMSIERHHFQWPWTTHNPVFTVTPFYDAEYMSQTADNTAIVAVKCK